MTDWRDCPDCTDEIDYPLVAAAASVGIEAGLSTPQMIDRYMAEHHRSRHQEDR